MGELKSVRRFCMFFLPCEISVVLDVLHDGQGGTHTEHEHTRADEIGTGSRIHIRTCRGHDSRGTPDNTEYEPIDWLSVVVLIRIHVRSISMYRLQREQDETENKDRSHNVFPEGGVPRDGCWVTKVTAGHALYVMKHVRGRERSERRGSDHSGGQKT